MCRQLLFIDEITDNNTLIGVRTDSFNEISYVLRH